MNILAIIILVIIILIVIYLFNNSSKCSCGCIKGRCGCPSGCSCGCNSDKLDSALNFQELWMEHMWYTREYLMRTVNDYASGIEGRDENTDAVASRLLQNQADLANAYNKIFPGTYDKVHTLLKDHILIAVDLVKAILTNSTNIEMYKNDWYNNASQIADTFASLGYNKQFLEKMMKEHLDTTTKELMALINDKPAIKEFDDAVGHMMHFNKYLLTNRK